MKADLLKALGSYALLMPPGSRNELSSNLVFLLIILEDAP
jgi:hypothetical protein